MELDHVEAFVAIVRRGGFTRAASALHLSQPAVSRRLHLLEHELGAPLFERIRTGVMLTDAGRAFLPYAEALLTSMKDGIEAVGALRGASQGTVSLAIVGTLASTDLTERLARFRAAHPAVDLRIRTALSSEVSALVRRGDATLGLRYDADPHPDLVSVHVHDEPMVVVCAARHRLARTRSVEARALAGEKWITFPPRQGGPREPYASALEQRLAASGLGASDIIAIDSLTAQKRMVEAGFGLALLPESSLDEELRSGTLRALHVRGLRLTVPVVMVHRRRAYQTGATQALASLLTEWTPRGRSHGVRRAPARTPSPK